MTKPVEIKVRNPRYAGATIGDLVRALVRPKKPPAEKPAKEAQADRIKFQRRREERRCLRLPVL